MRRKTGHGLTLTLILFVRAYCAVAIAADDPLNAFPTAKKPIEDRVAGLSARELEALRLPQKKSELVLSIARAPAAIDGEGQAKEPDPWLRVYADGRIDCGGFMNLPGPRRTDQLSDAELTWLLHLAVNECQLLTRRTQELEEAVNKETAQSKAERASARPSLPRHFGRWVQRPFRSRDCADSASAPRKTAAWRFCQPG